MTISKKITKKKTVDTVQSGTTLTKYVAHAGVCSRRNVATLVDHGVVTINGVVVTKVACRVQPGDVVKVYDRVVAPVEEKVYILFNKPNDCITTTSDESGRRTVMDLLRDVSERVYPVGRLDRKTTGLLLFTNDGELAEQLSHPRYEVRKIYYVELFKAVSEDDMKRLCTGVFLPDGMAQMDDVAYVSTRNKREIFVALHSGKYRIVRRMLEALNYDIKKLERVEYAGLTKKGLATGQWRYLTKDEIKHLKELKKSD